MTRAGAKYVQSRWRLVISALLLIAALSVCAFLSSAIGSQSAKGLGAARSSKARSKSKPHCKKAKGRHSSGRCHRKPPKGGSGKGKPKKPTKPSQPGPTPTQPVTPGPIQPVPGGSEPPPDLTPPDTAIDSGPSEGATIFEGSVSFAFSSPDDGTATFECSLDSAAFSTCQSPIDYAGLSNGTHSFKARAVDAAGNRDPNPASRNFKVDLSRADTTITARPPQTVVPNSTQELHFESNDS